MLSAYQTVAFGPGLAKGALLALAAFQADKSDDFRDMEPGKILHEVRMGELTQLGLKPHSPYYGSADSTPLWLILLSEYWRWTGDEKLVRSLRDNALAALTWIDESGDRDGDGYVEYGTRSSQGLGNQCWRDSFDGVLFSDGTIPFLPIATAEIQGYVYDAKLRLAELADGPLADAALAARLRSEAAALRERFERDFWIDARGGYYAIGLDGDKRQIDSMTSNIGQLLWTGIVSDERAAVVARQVMADPLFSGWGVRTLSTDDAGFNPIGYHLGTVWPHDNSLIAQGLARYGFRDEANRIAMALLDAAAFSGYRLPEAFSGYPRSSARFPDPIPDRLQPAGLGDRRAAPPRSSDARPGGARRAGHARPGAARRDRPRVDQRSPGVRNALGRGSERSKRSGPSGPRGLIQPRHPSRRTPRPTRPCLPSRRPLPRRDQAHPGGRALTRRAREPQPGGVKVEGGRHQRGDRRGIRGIGRVTGRARRADRHGAGGAVIDDVREAGHAGGDIAGNRRAPRLLLHELGGQAIDGDVGQNG